LSGDTLKACGEKNTEAVISVIDGGGKLKVKNKWLPLIVVSITL